MILVRSLMAPALALGLVAGAVPATEFKANSSFEQNGLKVEMDITPLADPGHPIRESEDVRLRFRIRESGDKGQAVSGLFPLSWLTSRDEGEPAPDEEACNYQIRGLLGGRLARSADVNLNEYLLITLDDNNSVSIIDPQVESSKTKTLGMVTLTSKGSDFVLAPDRRNVLVTLGSQGRIAAADIFIRKARYLDPGGQPRRIVMQPDNRIAWVGDAAGTKIHAVDTDAFKLLASIDVGPGPHEFAFRDDSRELYVVSPASTELAVVDTRTLKVKKQVKLGAGAVKVGYSAHSGLIYVAMADGELKILKRRNYKEKSSLTLEYAISDFAVSPDGHFGFALHSQNDWVSIVDLTENSVAHTIKTGRQPNHLDFTETFAYIHHASNGDALLVDLGSLKKSDPLVAQVVMGQQAPAAGKNRTIAPIVAPLPEGSGALVMNAADRAIYHFMEGMSAPMGSYQTYPWTAKGVLISDRTIREVEKGIYQTEFRLPGAGTYTLPFLVPTSPQLYGCFTVEIEHKGKKKVKYSSLQLEPLGEGEDFTAGSPQTLTVTVTDPTSGKPVADVDDLNILIIRDPRWQWRGVAVPLGEGRYQVKLTFPNAGQYMLMIASPSREVAFGHSRSISVKVVEATDKVASQSQ